LIDGGYDQLPNYHRRHEAPPGITGLAQIYRPDAIPDEAALKLPYDLEYVDRAHWTLDLRILIRTVNVMG
jgi:lipopolysaccharide/colanic/teichoic acid biosynthesis glycosyltransferase